MKTSLSVLLLFSMLVLPLAANAADKSQTQQAGSTAKEVQAKQEAPDVAKFDKQLAQMQETMHTMQEQMGNIQETQDPQERQKLLQDHWATMQNAMQTMRGMWGPGMMGCCRGNGMMGNMMGGNGTMGCCKGMMGGNGMMGDHRMGWNDMGGYYSKLTPEQMKQRQYMMDQYMGMQQLMMDNMMQHQNWMMQPSHP